MHVYNVREKKRLCHYVLYILMLHMWNGSQPTFSNAHFV